jgi:hypothetical protein
MIQQQRSARLAALLGIVSGGAAVAATACGARPSSTPAVSEVMIVATPSSADAGADGGFRPVRANAKARIASTVTTASARPPGHNSCYAKGSYEESECLSKDSEDLTSRTYMGAGVLNGPVEVRYPESEYVECCYEVEYEERFEPPVMGRPILIEGKMRVAPLITRAW